LSGLAITAPRERVDRLGLLLTTVGAVALIGLPFVVFKSNRIVPGEPRALHEVLPLWGALGLQFVLLGNAAVALGVADARRRLVAALAGIVVLALAVAAAANALTPPGNKVVRIAPGGASWVLLLCLGLMATDAITRMRPRPLVRVLLLVLTLAIAGAALSHGTFDNLSVMREYAVNAGRFPGELRRHVWLAGGSLIAALIVGLPLGVLCHRVPRLRPPVLGTLNVIQTIRRSRCLAFSWHHSGRSQPGCRPQRRSASVASAQPPLSWHCSCTRCCRWSQTRSSACGAFRRRQSRRRSAWA